MFNRFYNCTNPYQGKAKKVLCVCSAGLLRSPTAAHVLSAEPFNYNTRAVGVDRGHALIPIDEVLITWADEVLFVSPTNKQTADALFKDNEIYQSKKKVVLNIPDNYEYRNPILIEEIKRQYQESQLDAKTLNE